jgi:hypothetical protein
MLGSTVNLRPWEFVRMTSGKLNVPELVEPGRFVDSAMFKGVIPWSCKGDNIGAIRELSRRESPVSRPHRVFKSPIIQNGYLIREVGRFVAPTVPIRI